MHWIKWLTLVFCMIPISSFANSKTVHKFVDKKVAGITVGEYSEQKIFNLYGKGIPIEKGYAFCYYNKKEKSFLVVEYGPDKFIEGVIIIQENYNEYYDSCKKKEIDNTLQTSKGIKLGNSLQEVIEVYGEPQKRESKDGLLIFEYHTDYREDTQVRLAYDAYFYFKEGKLIKFVISDGE